MVTCKKEAPIFEASALRGDEKSYWEYRIQRLLELEKVIHCWKSEVGQAFRIWFDSHDVIVNKTTSDTQDPLHHSFVTFALRASLGAPESSTRIQTNFEQLFWKVLYHNGSARTVLNLISKLMGDKAVQRFLHMTVEHTLLGKYTHCNTHAGFAIRRKIREQLQTTNFPSKIVQEMVVHKQRPMLLLCIKEYLFDKLLKDTDFVWTFRKCVPNFDTQVKSVFLCCENIRFSLYKKIHEGHELHHILLNDGTFSFVDKAMRKFTPLSHRASNHAKLITSAFKHDVTRETKLCIDAAADVCSMTCGDVLKVFTKDEVLESLMQLEKMKFNNGACLAAVVWAKEVKLYKLPSFLSEKQICAFQKRMEPYGKANMIEQKMSSVLLCSTCKEVKNMSKREAHGFKNVKLFPLQNCAKCANVGQGLCDGKLTEVALLKGNETFCFKFFGTSYLIAPCCGLIISIDELTASSTCISCKYCVTEVSASSEKMTLCKCYMCDKIVKRIYKDKRASFTSAGSIRLLLKSRELMTKYYYFCKSHTRHWMYKPDNCPEYIEDVLQTIQSTSRLRQKSKRK